MASEEARARTLAVLMHADVVGSTELVQQNEAIAHTRITDAFSRLCACIRNYGGTVHEVRGDALVAEMQRASDAVAAAIAFQVSNAEENQRIEQLATPGGVCVTGAVHEATPSRMPFVYQDLGKNSAKGFADPVQVYAAELIEGEHLPAPDAPVAPNPTRTRSWSVWPTVLAEFVVACGAAWSQLWKAEHGSDGPTKEEQPLPDVPSIAVLPFSSISDDPEQEYFADGMTEDIITDLSQLSGLFVIARSSTFAFKKKSMDVRSIAKDLGIRYVLEGSVRRAGQQIRINAQLVDAVSGNHLWGERYDRDLSNVFAVQDEITRRIVVSLRITLTEKEHSWITHTPTNNVEAYDVFLRGRTEHYKLSKASIAIARELYQHAIESVKQAMRLNPKDQFFYQFALGFANSLAGRYDAAVSSLAASAANNPSFPPNYSELAFVYRKLDRSEEAEAAATQMLRLNSKSDDCLTSLSSINLTQRYGAYGAVFKVARDLLRQRAFLRCKGISVLYASAHIAVAN